MPSSSNNCVPFPVCCEPVYGYEYQQNEFLNVAISGNCPMGYAGGPFIVPAANFFSDTSQADADGKAQAFLDQLIATGCIPPTPPGSPTFNVSTTFSYDPPEELNINPHATVVSPPLGTNLTPSSYATQQLSSITAALQLSVEAHNTVFTSVVTIDNILHDGITVAIALGTIKACGLTAQDVDGDPTETGVTSVTRTVQKNGSTVGTPQTIMSDDAADHTATTPVQSVILAVGDSLTVTSVVSIAGTTNPDDGYYFTAITVGANNTSDHYGLTITAN